MNTITNLSAIEGFRALGRWVFLEMWDRGMQSRFGLIIPDDDWEHRGIRSRWFEVLAVGQPAHDETQLVPGKHVMVEHARWTRRMMRGAKLLNGRVTDVWATRPEEIWLVSDDAREALGKMPEIAA